MRNVPVHHGLLSSVGFRLLLIASLWQGPIFWGHWHQATAPGLASHVQHFHENAEQSWTLGWHWHCSFPLDAFPPPTDSPGDAPHSQQTPRDLPPSTSFELAVSRLAVSSSLIDSLGVDLLLLKSPSLGRSPIFPAASSGLLSLLQRYHAAQYVLCRMTC